MLDLIVPNWPAPSWIKAVTTTRPGGFSSPPFNSLNLSPSVGDNLNSVLQNRLRLKNSLGLTQDPIWLKQVHGNKATSAICALTNPTADAIYAREPNCVCAVQTADCLPLLVCSRSHPLVAAIHAGWKGLARRYYRKYNQGVRLFCQ